MAKKDTPKIIVVANHKGGVGKTTTAINLAVELARTGLNILFVDADSQRSASHTLGYERPEKVDVTLYNVLFDEGQTAAMAVRQCKERLPENLYLIHSDIKLTMTDIQIEKMSDLDMRDKFDLFRDKMNDPGLVNFDYIIVDTPPSLNLLVRNIFVAADYVIIPMQSGDEYSILGMDLLLQVLEIAKKSRNRSMKLLGMVITMYDSRFNVCKSIADLIKKTYQEHTFRTHISYSTEVQKELATSRLPITATLRSHKVSREYMRLAKEVLAKINHHTAGEIIGENIDEYASEETV